MKMPARLRKESDPKRSRATAPPARTVDAERGRTDPPKTFEELWQASSSDLRSGLQVDDVTDTFPLDEFDSLFDR
jgi:hypothetical protein